MVEIKRMSTEMIARSRLAALVAAVVLSFGGTVQAETSSDGVLVLSSRHIGMSSEEIAQSERVGKLAPAEEAVQSEWQSDHDVAPAVTCPPVAVADRSGIDFEGCVEAAIRAGNGYGESSRVCRSVFPERRAAPAVSARASAAPPAPKPTPPAPSTSASLEATPVEASSDADAAIEISTVQ